MTKTTHSQRPNRGPKFHGVGNAIKELRDEAQLNQAELAERIGWDKGRLSKYESNQLSLSFAAIEKIADAIGKKTEVVVLRCLKYMYPSLSDPNSQVAVLFDGLVAGIESHVRNRSKRRREGVVSTGNPRQPK